MNIATKNGAFEDAFPGVTGDSPLPCEFTGGYLDIIWCLHSVCAVRDTH